MQSEVVRAFYESHPYPPPVDDLRVRDDAAWRRADHFLRSPAEPFRDDPRILIAGCGTAQAARHALRWPSATVVGIDFSATSIRHSEDLKRKHGLSNLELRQLPIEQVGELGQRFDHVVCTGVLHHLPDPDAGLRALREALEPRATMQLMVYAPYGRAGIYMIADYCRMLGIEPTSAEIRDLSASLSALPPAHPLAPLLRNAPDFATEAGLADALLNPQDRAYSVPQLLRLLGDNGLRLRRFVRQAPYLPHCGAVARIPHAARIAALPVVEQYAAMELFRGTMVRHSVIAVRDDAPFRAAEREPGDVPMRLPEVRMIEERLPPGAAAVLLNPKQTYTDLFLPIDRAEKRLFEAIDGRRSIGDIERAGGRFFEKLWWHDLVIFREETSD